MRKTYALSLLNWIFGKFLFSLLQNNNENFREVEQMELLLPDEGPGSLQNVVGPAGLVI